MFRSSLTQHIQCVCGPQRHVTADGSTSVFRSWNISCQHECVCRLMTDDKSANHPDRELKALLFFSTCLCVSKGDRDGMKKKLVCIHHQHLLTQLFTHQDVVWFRFGDVCARPLYQHSRPAATADWMRGELAHMSVEACVTFLNWKTFLAAKPPYSARDGTIRVRQTMMGGHRRTHTKRHGDSYILIKR